MQPDTLLDEMRYFDPHPEARDTYLAFASAIRSRWPDVRVKVQKSQISFSNRYGFAYAWLPQGRCGKRRDVVLGVSFGLAFRLDSPRIFRAVEPYPDHWTHHVLLTGPSEVDDELLGWVEAAYDFSAQK